MTTPLFLLPLFALTLLINTIGFVRVVYFVSVGYAFSITFMCIATALVFGPRLGVFSALHLAGLTVWGLRLGIFLLRREAQPAYRKQMDRIRQQYGGSRRFIQMAIWGSVSVLYVMMFLPALCNLAEAPLLAALPTTALQAAGLALMAGGLGIEALADRQKSAFKAHFPDRFCDQGLYRWVRCPNYLGEILFWVGSWLMGMPFFASLWLGVGGTLGLVCIVLIMLGSTKRLEAVQAERYGSLPEYQNYIRTIPVLLPFVPIYSLKNVRVYLE